MKTLYINNKTLFYSMLIISLTFISFGCDTNVMFEDAMPPNVDIITTIPSSYQGTYLCESDSSIIHATNRSLVRESFLRFSSPIDQVRETEGCEIKNDSLFMPWSDVCLPFDYINDSTITATVHKFDTLFKFRKEEIAKYYKGRVFLNAQIYNDKKWVTSMLTKQEDGSVKWEQIQMPEDIEKVTAITPDFETKKTRKDETIYILNPTLVEFDKILEKNYVRQCDVFTPIYQPIKKSNYFEYIY